MGSFWSRSSSLPRLSAAALVTLVIYVLNKNKKKNRKCLAAPNDEKAKSPTQTQNTPPKVESADMIPPRPTRPPPSVTGWQGQSIPPPPTRPPPKLHEPAHGTRGTRSCGRNYASEAKNVEVWICLDFEWTCDEGEQRLVRNDEGEIIEFSYVIYDAKADAVTQAQHYCKNQATPITRFCSELTGITDETLKHAGSLADALHALEQEMQSERLVGRSCCAVAHGCADLELTLPRNCKDTNLKVPKVLRKYVDLREATQQHLAASGVKSSRATSLREICEALGVDMIGDEHCGLDDARMVLKSTKELLRAGAAMPLVDIDAEEEHFLSGTCEEQALCLDGLPFFALAPELHSWVEEHIEGTIQQSALSLILGLDGRASGRAIVNFGSHETAVDALEKLRGGRVMVCSQTQRLILARPLREREWGLPDDSIIPFPPDARALAALRGNGKGSGKGKGNGKGRGLCWQGSSCQRPNCHFFHPDGRLVDQRGQSKSGKVA